MDALPAWNSQSPPHASLHEQSPVHEEAWLLGQPPLSKYLDFVSETTVGGALHVRSALVDEWRAANDYYAELEDREAGIADDAEICDLDPRLAALADEVRADPRWRRGFDALPTRFAMVELDRLVISQSYVNLLHAETLKRRLGDSPTLEALFRFCLPLDRSEASVQMRRAGSNRFLFWSESTDFRFQEPTLLDPGQINEHDSFGSMAGVVGLMVGYGSNFLNVIEAEGRLLLHNGYHRAYALRELGVTHAPCIVQTASRRDELRLVAARAILEDPAFYLKAARPPLLKDFFDPKIRKILRVPKILRVVEISFEAKEFEIVDFASAVSHHA
jgi:hypothetical protein